MKRFYRNFITGIHNIFVWFPVIWRDRPWDYYFLRKVIVHKLTLMRKRWEEPNIEAPYVGRDIDLKWLRIAETLGKRMIEEGYYLDENNITPDSVRKAVAMELKNNRLFWAILEWRHGYWWD